MITVTLTFDYDGDPSAIADAVAQLIRTQTGEDIIVRINLSDNPNTISKMAVLNASQYVRRRPQI